MKQVQKNKDFEINHKIMENLIFKRYKVSKRSIFEDYIGNVALFILAIPLIIMSPLIILAQRIGGTR